MIKDYSAVTELAGDDITKEQLERLYHRYCWATTYCAGKDVIEVACGTGAGLGLLARHARSVRAGDYTDSISAVAQRHYGNRVDLRQFNAQEMPYEDSSADVMILLEALYYLPSADRFINECRRLLRQGGQVLIATANKDLYDFNPSPYSCAYYGVVELNELFIKHGFDVECFGYHSIREVPLRQKFLRPAKRLAASLGLIPKTMQGKKWLKRLVFGKLVEMPREITEVMMPYQPPTRLSLSRPDRDHKVIYCAATMLG